MNNGTEALRFVCPRTKSPLSVSPDGSLVSLEGGRYPVVGGIPVFLLDSVSQTIGLAAASLKYGQGLIHDEIPGIFLQSVGVSDEQRQGILELARRKNNPVDPTASFLVAATNGIGYLSAIGKLKAYPIPDLPVPAAQGLRFLDIGCSWGRWSVAADRKGYRVTGIDPSLGALAAAKRVCGSLGAKAEFVCGDARFLPFENQSFDTVFSYSVLQHMSPADVRAAVREIGRVLKPGGIAKIQMPNKYGLRCWMHQAKRRFREPKDFEVRYWAMPELRRLFEEEIGPSDFSVDCFFGLGLQVTDVYLMSPVARVATYLSELLKRVSSIFKPLIFAADSVYVRAVKSECRLHPGS